MNGQGRDVGVTGRGVESEARTCRCLVVVRRSGRAVDVAKSNMPQTDVEGGSGWLGLQELVPGCPSHHRIVQNLYIRF